jgi:hypothetical protein
MTTVLILVGRAQGIVKGLLRRRGLGDGMGGGFALDGDTALEKPRRRSHEQALFGTTRLGVLGGDCTGGRSVALLQVGLTLALGAEQRGRLGLFLKLRWPLM